MTFLNPYMLFGGLAMGIPLALHFFYRAHYRPLPWGAMKFLRLSIEQTSRRLRFQELILLLLRIAICLVLAFALARPASTSLTSGGGRGESVDAIIIIDTSYSMAAKEGDKTRLDRAKEAAIKVIDNLPPNSSAQIIACTDKATSLTLRTPTNLDQARHLVRNLKIASQSTDFFFGLDAAFAAFKKSTGANKEVYLISDLQRSGWERQSSSIRSKCEEIKDQASLYLVRCSEKSVKNVAIVGVMPQTDIPHTGARIAFTVLLKNSGAEAVSNLQLTLEVDGKALEKDSRSVDRIGAGDTRAVTITGKIDQPGMRLITARIKDDDLDEDNEFNRMILVRDRVRVLLVDGRPDDRNANDSAANYIATAILPIPDEMRSTYHVRLEIVRPESASAGALGDKDVCVLVDVAARQLKSDFTGALDAFVRSGKGLLITAGNNIVAKDYNAAFSELLPAALVAGEPYRAPQDKPLTPDPSTADMHSFLAKFSEGTSNRLRDVLANADTYAVLPIVDPKSDGGSVSAGRVLLRFNDGRPFLISKEYGGTGGGAVMLLTTSVDLSWSYFCINPSFQPIVHGCLSHLIERSSGSFNGVAGTPLRWTPADRNRDYFVIQPDGERSGLSRLTDEKVIETPKAGIYQIVAANEQQGLRFAVVPDLRESESLETLGDDQIDDQLGFKPIHLNTGFDGSSFTGTERSRKEWTILVLVALLIFALGETLWAWFCGKAW
jgi:hypothetical protein